MLKFFLKSILISLFLCSSCVYRSLDYQEFYAHLKTPRSAWQSMQEEDYFLVILVDACHLDYTSESLFLKSVAKHPKDGSKNGEVGHAWIYLQGKQQGAVFTLEGGHSGEKEREPPPYFEGFSHYHEWGCLNPTPEQILAPCYEPNPIKYLWTVRKDGFFQKGSGGHCPTFAAKIGLTYQQFKQILEYIKPSNYPYQTYSFLESQCCSFAAQVAELAGLSLDAQMSLNLAPCFYEGRHQVRLWEDPRYSIITFASPDRLEKSLIEAVEKGEAEYALDWYLKNRRSLPNL